MLDAIDACGLGSVTSQLVSKWKKSQSPGTSQRQPWIDCEAQASKFSGESKAERWWETLKDGSSQPTKRSSKRKQGSKDQSNNGSARRRKILGEENTETQDEENILNSHAKTKLKNRNHFLFSNACQ